MSSNFAYCSSESEIIELQKQNLIRTILEMKGKDEKRESRLQSVTTLKDRKLLEKRYVDERKAEESKVKMLVKDLETLKLTAAEGRLKDVESRRRPPMTAVAAPQATADRFLHCTLVDEIENTKEFYRRMDTLENRSKRAHSAHKFDQYAERKKLILLTQKKELLQQLLTVNTRALVANHGHDFEGRGTAGGSRQSSAPYSPSAGSSRSSVSQSSLGSRASWASFRPRENQAVMKPFPRPHFVPKLPI